MSFMRGTGKERSILWALLSPRGRIRRATFALAAGLLTAVFLFALFVADEDPSVEGYSTSGGPALLAALTMLACGFSLLMLGWKRLQDLGVPGLMILTVFPLTMLWPFAPLAVLGALALVPGRRGDNGFGPPPLRRPPEAQRSDPDGAATFGRNRGAPGHPHRGDGHRPGISGEGAGFGDGPGSERS